ncbi:hypothetical protein A2U01_0061363, partial [Trifolium medium]|nr:hypothetical protein [Trifolium medium]
MASRTPPKGETHFDQCKYELKYLVQLNSSRDEPTKKEEGVEKMGGVKLRLSLNYPSNPKDINKGQDIPI